MAVLYRLHFVWAFWYFLLLVQVPVVYLMYSVFKAQDKNEYHFASSLTKLIMLTGLLSMQVISLSF